MTDHPNLRSPALTRTLIIIFKKFLNALQALLCTPGVSNRRIFREVFKHLGEFFESSRSLTNP
jgi:hypothetical protein